jgi:hypothetical protein
MEQKNAIRQVTVTDHHLVVCLESLFCELINQKLNIYNSNGVKCAHVSLICLNE